MQKMYPLFHKFRLIIILEYQVIIRWIAGLKFSIPPIFAVLEI